MSIDDGELTELGLLGESTEAGELGESGDGGESTELGLLGESGDACRGCVVVSELRPWDVCTSGSLRGWTATGSSGESGDGGEMLTGDGDGSLTGDSVLSTLSTDCGLVGESVVSSNAFSSIGSGSGL